MFGDVKNCSSGDDCEGIVIALDACMAASTKRFAKATGGLGSSVGQPLGAAFPHSEKSGSSLPGGVSEAPPEDAPMAAKDILRVWEELNVVKKRLERVESWGDVDVLLKSL